MEDRSDPTRYIELAKNRSGRVSDFSVQDALGWGKNLRGIGIMLLTMQMGWCMMKGDNLKETFTRMDYVWK